MTSDDPSAPKRHQARFLAASPAVLRFDGRDLPCSAHDLSRAGVLLEGQLVVPDDPEVRLTLTTPAGDLTATVSGRVMHAHEEASGEIRLGIQFDPLTEEQEDVIDRLISRVIEGMAPAALAEIDEKAPLAEIRAALARITPAHRHAIASRGGPTERAILRHDTDPHVLEGLARNPKMNLPEMRTLLRRTDLLPSTLECVAADPRWLNDEELQIMIATHLRASFRTADKVVTRMSDLTLAKVIRRPGLQPGVRQKLMTRLARKNRGA
jgi:hypothetical protein